MLNCVRRTLAMVIILSCSLVLITGCNSDRLVDSSITQDITKITLWHGINPPANRDVFAELVQKFNQANPDIEVEPLYIGQPDAQLPKIFAATVSGEAPDMLWFVPQIAGKLNRLGVLLPLQDWFNNSPVKTEVDPAMLESMTLDGQILSIPFATNNTAVFYRPDLFQKAGVTKPPQNWQELKQVASRLTQDTNQDGKIDRHGIFLSLGKGEWTVFAWLPFVYSAGGEIISDNLPNLVNEGTINALQLGADLVQAKSVILSAPERGYEMDNFIAGRVAMQVTGPWTLGQLATTDIEYDVFPIPPAEKPAAVIGGENLFLFKSNQAREEASKRFFEYVLSEEFQTNWALKTGYLPINLKSQQSTEYQAFIQDNPVLEVFLQQMSYARSRPIIPQYTRLSENLGRAIEAVLLGKSTPEAALKKSQQRLDLLFD